MAKVVPITADFTRQLDLGLDAFAHAASGRVSLGLWSAFVGFVAISIYLLGYRTASVRAVPLVNKKGEVEEANETNALSGKYPLARFFYIYVNKAPNKPLSPLDAEFLKLILGRADHLAPQEPLDVR